MSIADVSKIALVPRGKMRKFPPTPLCASPILTYLSGARKNNWLEYARTASMSRAVGGALPEGFTASDDALFAFNECCAGTVKRTDSLQHTVETAEKSKISQRFPQ